MTAHAKLAPSAAARWINCPPSVILEAQFPDVISEYAEEGTVAHKCAELEILSYFLHMPTRMYTAQLEEVKKEKAYQDEMLEHARKMLNFIEKITQRYNASSMLATETRVDCSRFAKGCYGTADCIIINGNDLWVVDYKYGKGVPVSAEMNPQLMLYGLGAINRYGVIYDIKNIKLCIVQPRLGSETIFDISRKDLEAWGSDVVKPAAELALKGGGAQKAGAHCKFCKAKALCKAQADYNLGLARMEFKDAELLTDAEIGEVLSKAEALVSWTNAIKDYALASILKGKKISGWKAVEGRSVRAFTDTDAAFKTLTDAGYDEAMLYERRPITLSAVEKLMGKKHFNEVLHDFIVKPQGKPTLAPEDDKRNTYGLSQAQQEFI